MAMTRILGLDFGTRRVGAAVSDPGHSIATPLEVHERRRLSRRRPRGERREADREAPRRAPADELDAAAARQPSLEETVERGHARRERVAPRGRRRQIRGARQLRAEAREKRKGGALPDESSAFEKRFERRSRGGERRHGRKIGVIKA